MRKNLLFILLLFSCGLVTAATYTVTKITDDGTVNTSGSLSWAINQSNISTAVDDIINFDLTSGSTITVSESLPVITDDVTINGNDISSGLDITVQVSDPGISAYNVFRIDADGITVEISNMTVKGGDVGAGNIGGSLWVSEGVLNLTNVHIQGSKAGYGGGLACAPSGADAVAGTVTMTNCSVSDCESDNYGGGIYCQGFDLNMINCTVDNNSANDGGGLYIWEWEGNNPSSAAVVMKNCTFYGNSAFNGGGINLYAVETASSLAVYFSTICGNTATILGGGIYDGTSTGLTVKNSILANNTGADPTWAGPDIYSGPNITDLGYNIVEFSNGYTWDASGDITGEQANLFGTGQATQTLANNGGLTQTLAIETGSVAIGAGAWDATLTTDQRGEARHSSPTIGSYEADYSQTWAGTSSSAWETASNWSPAVVPTNVDNITIPQVSAPASNPVIGSTETADCNDLTIESGGSLTINPGGSLITNGTITSNGTVNIKQSLTEDGHWHFISVPNATTLAGDLFTDMYLQQWNEGTTGWEDITDLETNLTPVKGYSLWMPGGAKMDFTYTGTPNTGDPSIPITAAGSGESAGMNLVGNPYPSYIDWDQVSGYGSKYTWNGTAYLTYTQTGGYGEGSQYVAPMEGFFIYTASAKDFALDNSMRCHQPVGKSGSNLLQNGLVLEANNGSYRDALWILFRAEANEGFEISRDAWKILSGTNGLSQLWSENSDGMLSVDVRPETETIQLGFTNNEAGTYSIGIKEIADISTAILEDTKLNVFYDLNDGEYTFDWSLNDNETRFKLHFNTTAIEETDINTLKVFVSGGMINISSNTPAERIILSNITGQILSIYEGSESIPAPKIAGVYLVSIENDGQRITQKIIVN